MVWRPRKVWAPHSCPLLPHNTLGICAVISLSRLSVPQVLALGPGLAWLTHQGIPWAGRAWHTEDSQYFLDK